MSTKVYALYIDSNDSLGVYLGDKEYDDFYTNNFIGKKMTQWWSPPPYKIENPRLPLKDFIAGTLMAPLVSERAYTVLFPLLKEYAEFLPCLKINNIMYYY